MPHFSSALITTLYGCRLRLCGELDMAARDELIGLLPALTDGHNLVEVDLAEVTFIDSSGIHGLLSIKDAVDRAGSQVEFVDVSGACSRLLAITGLGFQLGVSTGEDVVST
jgi:anti-sigma B factor antagonist